MRQERITRTRRRRERPVEPVPVPDRLVADLRSADATLRRIDEVLEVS